WRRFIPAQSNEYAEVRQVAFGQGSHVFATVESDLKVRFWEVATGRLVRTLPAVKDFSFLYVVGFALSRDGKHLAISGVHPHAVYILDANTGEVRHKIDVVSGRPYLEVAFSPDSSL